MYEERDVTTRSSAERILLVVQRSYGPIQSAIDVGCGVGTFLKVLREMGTSDVLGVDGSWVDEDLLEIASSESVKDNLEDPQSVGRKFDLAICLEVAEHLPNENADSLVHFLVELSDLVLFSAAIPGQGGEGHVNEQWQSYWAQKFANYGYETLDSIRCEIWNDPEVLYWYKQNTLVYRRRTGGDRGAEIREITLDIVHPNTYLSKLSRRRLSRSSWIPGGPLRRFILRFHSLTINR